MSTMPQTFTFTRLLRLIGVVMAIALPLNAMPLNASAQPAAAPTASVKTEHAKATLILSRDRAQPGETVWAALKIEMDPGWHTYWRNPGDSGLPGAIEWTLPSGLSAGEIAWPAPERIPYGPLINFGYSNTVLLPVPLTIDQSISTAQTLTIDASGNWLVCAEICIPDSGTFRVTLNVDPGKPSATSLNAPEIEQTLAAMPKPVPWPVTLVRDGGNIILTANPAFEIDADTKVTFFPFDAGLIDNAGTQNVDAGDKTLTITVAAAPTPLDLPAQTGGLLVVDAINGKAAYSFSTESPAVIAAPNAAAEVADVGLWAAIVFAFLGGLILNLMPCVLPVLAMKALAFAAHSSDSAAERRRDGAAYTLGVLATFGVLAGLLIGLRSAGTEIGWGFQLQSPSFVTVIAYVLLALGLNLSGVFAIGGGIMGVGQNLTQRSGAVGAFFTGALAVVVATPCTAPLMGAAMGYAMTQPPLVTLLVFESLGLGLAAPFLLFSLVPQAAKILPKPGVWMDRLKQVLAFPLYASAAWMVWVLSQQVGPEGFAAGLAGLVFLALSVWLFGLAQTAARLGASAIIGAMAFLAAVGLVVTVSKSPGLGAAANMDGATYEPYAPARLAELRAQGRPVFVNFTAAWCITCLMNERVALSTAAVKQAMADKNVAYLKADWTNRDPEIAKTLASFGRSGVPLYIYYAPKAAEPEVLPQLLTPGLMTSLFLAE
ncbi:MAG: thioredoxin family protein [Rhodospirillaceae bacterium]|nr:thioredoxin family protein [Rhodospirillaceae bacterium]